MSNIQTIVTSIGVNLLVLFLAMLFLFPEKKIGYVSNQALFEQFNGKIELGKKLKRIEDNGRARLDSLALVISVYANNVDKQTEAKQAYKIAEFQFNKKYEEQNQLYTNQIWTQINQYLLEYGKKEGYEYIHGTSGNGSLMYGDEANNITEEVLEYINDKYNGA